LETIGDWWRYGGDAVQVQMTNEDQKLKAKRQNAGVKRLLEIARD
jgi:hypothetical protein